MTAALVEQRDLVKSLFEIKVTSLADWSGHGPKPVVWEQVALEVIIGLQSDR